MSLALPKSEFYISQDAITLIQGNHSLAVLDRLVTTRINDIQDHTRREVLFCDYNGRISDIATIYSISGSILLSSSGSRSDVTRKKLVDGRSWDEECEILIADKAIFRISIFPNDLVQIEQMFGIDLEDSAADVLLEKDDLLFARRDSENGAFFDILVKFENIENILIQLRKSGYNEMDSIGWNNARVKIGLREICDSLGNLPGEMGMESLVSNDKGCYPGQEIHARLESRGRNTKSLCRLTGDSPLKLGTRKLSDLGKISISSAIFSDGIATGFALIRLDSIPPGSLEIDGNNYSIEIMGYP
ncbi:MAG: hypothetical protein VYA39_01595 [Candidatus Thermoplasmatota archaeon]|nr:hypothetical protein [Candidatus Thermoplasmatota archaeon]